jgi:phosphopantothenoylcysteine decarboxylase/phosphopantothenate--cysteine ligase
MCKIEVESADEMFKYLIDSIRIAKKGVMTKPKLQESGDVKLIEKKPFLFMASAVSDYKPKFAQSGKLKSDMIGENWNLELVENIDILETVSKDGIISIGFKAEMDSVRGKEFATKMLSKKNLDAVCLNILKNSSSFGTDENQVDMIFKSGDVIKLEKLDKMLLSIKIIEKVQKLDS